MSNTGKSTTFYKKVDIFDQRSWRVKNGIKNGYLTSKLVIKKPLGKIIGTCNFRLRGTNIGSR